MDIEEPVCCGYAAAFHLHPTLPGMLGPTLIRDEVVQMREAREKRLLAASWMVKPLHSKQLSFDGVMRLIQEGTRHGHLRVCEHRIPAGFSG